MISKLKSPEVQIGLVCSRNTNYSLTGWSIMCNGECNKGESKKEGDNVSLQIRGENLDFDRGFSTTALLTCRPGSLLSWRLCCACRVFTSIWPLPTRCQ